MISTARVSSWLIVLVVAWGVGGCGSSQDAEPPAPSPGATQAAARPEAAQPANLPDDVPQYADSEVAFVHMGADMTVSLRLWTDDEAADVTAYYADQLAANGWATEIRKGPDGNVVLADKPGRKLMLTVGKSEDGERTQVDLVVGQLPQ